MKRIVVFCGSSIGDEPVFETQARMLGKALADRNLGLVYGGANVGLMAAVANGCLEQGGKVIGVLPQFLKAKELAHPRLTRLITVETMHERKTVMNELSDGVIALPGGFGTLEEFFEMLTWAQLGLHKKPVALLNVAGFYDHLLALSQNMFDNGFLKKDHLNILLHSSNVDELLDMMQRYEAPFIGKWIKKDKI